MAVASGNLAGNWPSYVHLKVKRSTAVRGVVLRALESAALKEEDFAQFVSKRELHISLSRQFYLRTHHIDSFLGELGLALGSTANVAMRLDSKHFTLSNDTESRRFLCVPVHDSTGALRRLVDDTSATLTRFRQAAYYENPIFHISIAETRDDGEQEASDAGCGGAVASTGTGGGGTKRDREGIEKPKGQQPAECKGAKVPLGPQRSGEGDDECDDDEGDDLPQELAEGHLETHLTAAAVYCNIGNRSFRLELGSPAAGSRFLEQR